MRSMYLKKQLDTKSINTQLSEQTNSLRTIVYAKAVEINKANSKAQKFGVEEQEEIAKRDYKKKIGLDNMEDFVTHLHTKESKTNPYFHG
jgi:hypothetical protein